MKTLSAQLVEAKLAVATLKKHSNGTVQDRAIVELADVVFAAFEEVQASPPPLPTPQANVS